MTHTRAAAQAVGMLIRDCHPDERPREKLLATGPDALSDAELLAILLGSGQRGEPVLALAHRLLREHDGLRGLLDLEVAGLQRIRGLGPARACLLRAALTLGSRHLAASMERGELLGCPELAAAYVSRRLRRQPREQFACLFLDTRHRLLRYAVLFEGGLDHAEVHPREVVRQALECHAAAVIVAHNHPSGDATPSAADRVLTQRLHAALALVDVRLLDHLVVGEGPATSMAQLGWLR